MERLEAFASRFIEGWSARLFGAKLQPVQIAKRVIRAMESHQTISLSKTFVPNSYVVSLSPTDFEGFEQYRRSLEQDLSEAVLGAARDRNYTLLAYPIVEIERDEDLPPGDMRVSCALVDASGDEVTADPKALGGVESGHTMVLDREKLLREKPRAPKAAITVRGAPRVGDRLPLRAVNALGRDAGNDIVINDEAASARHALVEFADGEWWVEDAGSTNGTVVNGAVVRSRERLQYGDELAIGRVALRLEQ